MPRRAHGEPATYGNYSITMTLPTSIGMSRFTVTTATYQQIWDRESIPEGLGTLLTELFERRVIVRADISYGTKMVLNLARQTPEGRSLLLGGALQQFLAAFQDITDRTVNVTWESSGSPTRERSSRRSGTDTLNGVLDVISAVVEALSDD